MIDLANTQPTTCVTFTFIMWLILALILKDCQWVWGI